MEEQKFKIGEEVFIMNAFDRPIKVMVVNYKDNVHDPRTSKDRNMYTLYHKTDDNLCHIFEEGIFKTQADAYINNIKNSIVEGDPLTITVDDEYYTIKIKKGE